MKYSASTGGFYIDELHGASIPVDAVDVSQAAYEALLDGQAKGKRIGADQTGHPVLLDAPVPAEQELEVQAGAVVRKMLDELAQSWSYSSYISARAYKGDVSRKFDAEGTALADYGSACYTKLDQIRAGEIPRPVDMAGLLALMPPAPPRPVVS